jgi:hypothetical protein
LHFGGVAGAHDEKAAGHTTTAWKLNRKGLGTKRSGTMRGRGETVRRRKREQSTEDRRQPVFCQLSVAKRPKDILNKE